MTDTIKSLRARLEAAEDALLAREAEIAILRDPDAERIPLAVAEALILGDEHPIRVWRKYRDMTARQLAAASGVSTAMLSEIETGKRDGRLPLLRRIAQALGVTLDDIVPDDEARGGQRAA